MPGVWGAGQEGSVWGQRVREAARRRKSHRSQLSAPPAFKGCGHVVSPCPASLPSPGAVPQDPHLPPVSLLAGSGVRCPGLQLSTGDVHLHLQPHQVRHQPRQPSVSGPHPVGSRPHPAPVRAVDPGPDQLSSPCQLGHHSVPAAHPGPRRLPDLEQPAGALRGLQTAGRLRARGSGQRGDHGGGHGEAGKGGPGQHGDRGGGHREEKGGPGQRGDHRGGHWERRRGIPANMVITEVGTGRRGRGKAASEGSRRRQKGPVEERSA